MCNCVFIFFNFLHSFVIDNGLVIPTVSWETNKTITETAEKLGFSKTRQVELFGVNAGQMALTVLGGTNRLVSIKCTY